MNSIIAPVAVIRFFLVALFASVFVVACDSDGDSRQLINLVTVAEQGYTRIEINGDTETVIETGESTQLSLQAFTGNEDVTGTTINADEVVWRSSNRNIAEVDPKDGTVFGRDIDGTAEITANFGNLFATTSLRVSSAPLVSINIRPPGDATLLNECSATQFEAGGMYEGDPDERDITDSVVWSVPETSAVISATGLLRVTAAGQISVVATRPASEGRLEVVQSEPFTVDANLVGISIQPEAGELAVDDPLQYRAFAIYANIDDTTLEITDNLDWTLPALFAQVDNTLPEKGNVTPDTAGTGTLTATCVGADVEGSIEITAAGSGEILGFIVAPLNDELPTPLEIVFRGEALDVPLVARALFQDQPGGENVTDDAEWSINITSGVAEAFQIGNDDDDKGLLTIRGVGRAIVTAVYFDDDDEELRNTLVVESNLP